MNVATTALAAADRVTTVLNRAAPLVLPVIARFAFAAVLAGYFWSSATTKFDGPFTPSVGAYAQIFPKAFEAAGYNVGNLSLWHSLVVLLGGWSEAILPLLILIGLATRLASLAMIGFIVVQSLTDIYGHGVDPQAIGMWFDRVPDAAILDSRLLWIAPLFSLIFLGAGPLSLDQAIRKLRANPPNLAKY